MKLGLSPGCLAWIGLETPYVAYQREIDYVIFETGDRKASTLERPSGTPGIDVMVELHDKNKLLGFVIWGGSLGFAKYNNDVLPPTLSSLMSVLEKLVRDRFSWELTFCEYDAQMRELMRIHAELPVQVIGGHAIDMN